MLFPLYSSVGERLPAAANLNAGAVSGGRKGEAGASAADPNAASSQQQQQQQQRAAPPVKRKPSPSKREAALKKRAASNAAQEASSQQVSVSAPVGATATATPLPLPAAYETSAAVVPLDVQPSASPPDQQLNASGHDMDTNQKVKAEVKVGAEVMVAPHAGAESSTSFESSTSEDKAAEQQQPPQSTTSSSSNWAPARKTSSAELRLVLQTAAATPLEASLPHAAAGTNRTLCAALIISCELCHLISDSTDNWSSAIFDANRPYFSN